MVIQEWSQIAVGFGDSLMRQAFGAALQPQMPPAFWRLKA